MSSRLLVTAILFLFPAVLLSQSNFNELTGTWQLLEMSEKSGEPELEIIPPGGKKHHRSRKKEPLLWHFTAGNRVLIRQTAEYVKAFVYSNDGNELVIDHDVKYKILESDQDGLVLSIKKGRPENLFQKTFRLKKIQDQNDYFDPIETFVRQQNTGDLRYDGVYLYEGTSKSKEGNLAFRFYPDSSLIVFPAKKSPSNDVEFFLKKGNRLYMDELAISVDHVLPLYLSGNKGLTRLSGDDGATVSTLEMTINTDEVEVLFTRNAPPDQSVRETMEMKLTFYPIAGLPFYFEGHPDDKNATAEQIRKELESQNYRSEDKIMEKVDVMPLFSDCGDYAGTAAEKKRCSDMRLLEFVYRRISYPKEAVKKGVEGICVVSFVVEKDGSISNAKIVRDIGAGCGKESLRVVNLMSSNGIRWTPGENNGRPVRVQFNFPVKFALQ